MVRQEAAGKPIDAGSRHRLRKVVVLCVTFALALTLADGVLGWLGFPSDVASELCHPPDFVETRQYLEFTYEFRTNGDGLRYEHVPHAKPVGERRVLVVGDSITEGFGVDAASMFTNVLEARRAAKGEAIRFINAGMSGRGPIRYRSLIRHLAPRFDVDAVLVVLFANDLWDMAQVDLPADAWPPVEASGVAAALHTVWPRLVTLGRRAKARAAREGASDPVDLVDVVTTQARSRGIPESRIRDWIGRLPPDLLDAANRKAFNGAILSFGLLEPRYWSDSIDLDRPEAEAKWGRLQEVLEDIEGEQRRDGRRVAFVYVPVVFQYDPRSHDATRPWPRMGTILRARWLEGASVLQRRLRDHFQAAAVPYLDLTEPFRAAFAGRSPDDPELNWTLDEHLTPAGDRVVADHLDAWIRQIGLLEDGARR